MNIFVCVKKEVGVISAGFMNSPYTIIKSIERVEETELSPENKTSITELFESAVRYNAVSWEDKIGDYLIRIECK